MSALNQPTAIIAEDEPLLAAAIKDELARAWPGLVVVAVVHDGHAAIEAIERHAPQVAFLDVQMPGLSGLEVARLISATTHIVFVTAHDHYAVQAFDAGAIDYLLKPLDPVRLARALQRVRQRFREPPADLSPLLTHATSAQAASSLERLRWLTVPIGRELRLIAVDDVCYFKADNKYVEVVTDHESALMNTPLRDILPRLDPDVFWQVHRGTVVNVQRIRSVVRGLSGKLHLQLKSRPEKLEVSATYAHRFRQL
jgi:DNA-binding LytR/AlgR family response regulator